ncbi:hypothetical protein SBA4_920003 [Candidatus Sulfopaludibacter sp. SbA4]|nr:hypothetical protein SBA4_920003 [Candidatus Sulfopaludibacter sp. SbA4]
MDSIGISEWNLIDVNLSPGIDIMVPTPAWAGLQGLGLRLRKGYGDPSRVSPQAGRTSPHKSKREI